MKIKTKIHSLRTPSRQTAQRQATPPFQKSAQLTDGQPLHQQPSTNLLTSARSKNGFPFAIVVDHDAGQMCSIVDNPEPDLLGDFRAPGKIGGQDKRRVLMNGQKRGSHKKSSLKTFVLSSTLQAWRPQRAFCGGTRATVLEDTGLDPPTVRDVLEFLFKKTPTPDTSSSRSSSDEEDVDFGDAGVEMGGQRAKFTIQVTVSVRHPTDINRHFYEALKRRRVILAEE
ncbi:hypothetical protein JTE90_000295 [Oedothorax gibbosus]|uniref:Uncharacterized protein n=1 Tax=Oedothorax gibbosus TaxID=931172 RepID=A0AAV6VUG7_9ARAC|nr:hypothetical protein JTE90_000295 [Oedothorax gibbosus]